MNFRRRVSLSLLVPGTIGFIFSANISLAQPVVDLLPGEVTVERIPGTGRAIVHFPCELRVIDEFPDFHTTTGIFVDGVLVATRAQTVFQVENAPPIWCIDRVSPACPGEPCPQAHFCGQDRDGLCLDFPNTDICACFYASPMDPEVDVPDGEFFVEVVMDFLDEVAETNEDNNISTIVVPPPQISPTPVPTVSEWGLVLLTLLLLTGITVKFNRRRGRAMRA